MKSLKTVPSIDPSRISELIEKYPDKEETIRHAALFGPNALFRPTKTDHIHSLSREKKLPLADALDYCSRNLAYSQMKLEGDFEYKGQRLFQVDVDDKGDGAGVALDSLKRFQHDWDMPHATNEVKTPTGDGRHLLYWLPKGCKTSSVPFDFGDYPGLEFMAYPEGSGQTIVLAGSYKKDGTGKYVLIGETEPLFVSDKLSSAIETQSEYYIDNTQRIGRNSFESFGGKIDSELAQTAYTKVLMSQLTKEPILEGNRNKRWWQILLQGLEGALSLEKTIQLVDLYLYPNSNFNKDQSPEARAVFDAAAYGAQNHFNNSNQKLTKAPLYESWEEDSFGMLNLTKKTLYKRIDMLGAHSLTNQLRIPAIRTGLCSVIIHDTSVDEYLVPRILSGKVAEHNYQKSIKDEETKNYVSFVEPIREFEETGVTWKRYSAKDFRSAFRFHDGKSKNPTVLLNSEEFFQNHLSAKKVVEAAQLDDEDLVFSNGEARIPVNDVVEPLTDLEYEVIKHKVLEWERKFFKDLAHNERDREHLLNRFAINVQRPFDNVQHAVTLFGPQANGKSLIFEVFAAMFPSNLTSIVQGNEQLTNRFTEKQLITICEEIVPDKFSGDDHELLKSIIGAPNTSFEAKGRQKRMLGYPSNFYISTNDRPTKTEYITGRRHSVLPGNFGYDTRNRPNEISDLLKQAKADHYKILRGWKTRLLKKDISDFNPQYKSDFQREMALEIAKGLPIMKFLIGYILNRGHINGKELLRPGSYVTGHDIIRATYHYDDPFVDPVDINIERGTRVQSLMNNGPNTIMANKIKFLKYMPDPNKVNNENKKIKSKFGGEANYGHILPSIKDAIRCYTLFALDSDEDADARYIAEKYGIMEHWNEEPFFPTKNTINHNEVIHYDEMIKNKDDF